VVECCELGRGRKELLIRFQRIVPGAAVCDRR
jgi:hypothetical protein